MLDGHVCSLSVFVEVKQREGQRVVRGKEENNYMEGVFTVLYKKPSDTLTCQRCFLNNINLVYKFNLV